MKTGMSGVCVAVVFLTACGSEGDAPGRAMTVRDSAGVTVVENHDSVWTAETRWRIADEPELVIGSVDGSAPGTDFGSSLTPVMLSDGVAVHDHQTREIRLFDSAGRLTRTLGGRGDGPTEFRSISEIAAIRGDSIAVFDGNARKIVIFPVASGDARVMPTVDPLHGDRYGWEVSGWLESGGYVHEARDPPRAGPAGVRVDSVRHVLYSAAGDSLDAFEALPLYTLSSNGTRQVRALFSQWAITRTRGSEIVHGFPEVGFQLEVVDTESGVRRILRRSFRRVPSPEGALEEAARQEIEANQGRSPEVAQAVRALWDAAAALDSLPAYGDFRVASDGHLWVNHVAHPDAVQFEERPWVSNYGTPDWTVFDPDGRWLGTVRVPDDFTVHEVGNDWVLGVREDGLGIPWVERYRILKP